MFSFLRAFKSFRYFILIKQAYVKILMKTVKEKGEEDDCCCFRICIIIIIIINTYIEVFF